MNKTLKTIAWICLALGLLGMVVDAGALIAGRNMMANRLAIAGQNNTPPTGSAPQFGAPCQQGTCQQENGQQENNQQGKWQQGFGGRFGRGGMMFNFRERFNHGRFGLLGIFALFFMALGPVLAIVGAVILLVNREPKNTPLQVEKEVKQVKEEKADKKK
jgi:hypothetical protein